MKIYFILFSLFVSTLCLRATIIPAASGSPTDVQAAYNLASSGDTVTIPAGTNHWTANTSWSVPANITVMGAGNTNEGGGDQTIIIDDFASGSPLMTFNASGSFRMTGITVMGGTGSQKDNGTIAMDGKPIRIDHCHLLSSTYSDANNQMIAFYAETFGVLDHCILDFTYGNGALYFENGRRTNSDNGGNFEWTLPPQLGSTNFFFVEDNLIYGGARGDTYSTRIFDGFSSARVVVRFNTCYQVVLGETHGTGHSGDDRGLRAQEIYGNLVTSSLTYYPNFSGIEFGNGTGLCWGNSWDQVYKHLYTFQVVRLDNSTYNQAPTPSGWGYAGTHYNGTGSQWDGGTSSGSDTTYGYPCIDQPGRGQGDLLVNDFPSKVNQTTGTIHWPNQAYEPIYIWNNTGTIVSGWGGFPIYDDSGGRVQSDRDYFLPASGVQTSSSSPFNGTTGTGWGTLANRPTTCLTGVGYFATDQGSWNKSTSNPYGVQQSGASGVLYVATAPNTWTIYVTPAVYPSAYQNITNSPTVTSTGGGMWPPM